MADRKLFLTKVENQRFKTAELITGGFIGISKAWVADHGSGSVAYFADQQGDVWCEADLKNFVL